MEFIERFADVQIINNYIKDCKEIELENREEYMMANAVAQEIPENYFSGKKLIDIGCGPGTSFPIWAEQLGFTHITAIDGSQEALTLLNKRIRRQEFSYDVTTHLVELENDLIPVEQESVDAALCAATLFYIRDIKNVFKEVSRILKPTGFFAFEVCIHDNNYHVIERGPGGCNFYNHPKEHLASFMENYDFEFVHAILEDENEHEGHKLSRYYMLWRKAN